MEGDCSRQDQSWQNYQAAANEALDQRHYGKASRILREALGQENEFVDPLLVHSANKLADHYSSQGKYASAAPLYRTVLDVLSRQFGEEHPQVQASRRNLALALWQIGGISPNLFAANEQ